MDEDIESAFNELLSYVRILERRIERLENNMAPTVPIYDKNNWPQDAVEGQVVISPIT